MKIGQSKKLVIPADQAYGSEGRQSLGHPNIPPNTELTFDVKLDAIKSR